MVNKSSLWRQAKIDANKAVLKKLPSEAYATLKEFLQCEVADRLQLKFESICNNAKNSNDGIIELPTETLIVYSNGSEWYISRFEQSETKTKCNVSTKQVKHAEGMLMVINAVLNTIDYDCIAKELPIKTDTNCMYVETTYNFE